MITPPVRSRCRTLPHNLVLSRMHFTVHAARRPPHDASRLVHAIPAWSVNTRRAPSRRRRHARVCGHTTRGMHEVSTHLPRRSYFSMIATPHPRSGGLCGVHGERRSLVHGFEEVEPDGCLPAGERGNEGGHRRRARPSHRPRVPRDAVRPDLRRYLSGETRSSVEIMVGLAYTYPTSHLEPEKIPRGGRR